MLKNAVSLHKFNLSFLKTALFAVAISLAFCFTACASKDKSDNADESGHSKASYDAPVVSDSSEGQETNQPAEAIKLPTTAKSKSYFAKISDEIVKND